MPEIPGFHVKYADIEIEFYSQDSTTVANNYRSLLEWLQKKVDVTLDRLDHEVKQLKEDMTELKRIRSENQHKPDRGARRT